MLVFLAAMLVAYLTGHICNKANMLCNGAEGRAARAEADDAEAQDGITCYRADEQWRLLHLVRGVCVSQ
jgi:hypothetical protein